MNWFEHSGDVEIPKGLVEAVVGLVDTGPVPLGGYTLAEIDAVSGVIHFLEREPEEPTRLVAQGLDDESGATWSRGSPFRARWPESAEGYEDTLPVVDWRDRLRAWRWSFSSGV